MFHKASVRLAALYLAVIMLISLFFSVNIYQLSIGEFDRGFHQQQDVSQDSGGGPIDLLPKALRKEFMRNQDYIYQEAKTRVFNRLVFTNLIILVGGGALSYYLARRTLKPIEEAHAAQSRFTADASHELRTPIAAMQSEIEVTLMDPKLTLPQAKKVLVSNLEELVKLTSLTEGLLKLATLEHGDVGGQEVGVNGIVHDAVGRVSATAEAKNIIISVNGETKSKVAGDAASLTEAIVVLLENAVKYSPDKSEVKVNVFTDTKKVILEVEDHGAGIKSKDLAHIFERFYRADSARSNSHTDGYGVGLAIAKNIVDLHGGTILAKSKPNKGSTFTIELPTV